MVFCPHCRAFHPTRRAAAAKKRPSPAAERRDMASALRKAADAYLNNTAMPPMTKVQAVGKLLALAALEERTPALRDSVVCYERVLGGQH